MNAPAAAAHTTPVQISAAQYDMIPLAAIKLSGTPLQILRRSHFDKNALAELAADIKAHGLLQPVLVRHIHPPQGAIRFELVAGERRFLAAQAAKLPGIPAMTRTLTDNDMVEMQISENLQRENLHPLEEAEGYQQLCAIHKCAAKDLVARVGKNEAHIYARLKLLALAPPAKEIFYANKITHSVALEIARIPDAKMQQQAALGCATGDDLGDYCRNSDEGGPLTITEARDYIQEEFMTRIEGDRKIAEARKAGKTVITGADAEKLIQHGQLKAHINLDDAYYGNGHKPKQYRDVIESPADTVIIQMPDGAAVEAVPHDVARKIFTAKKLELPYILKPSGSNQFTATTTDAEKARIQRERAKARLEIEIRLATFKAVRQRYPLKLGKPELLELIPLMKWTFGTPPETIAPLPKALDKLTEKELVGVALDLMLGGNLNHEYKWKEPRKRCLAAAKRYGVNPDKIKTDLTNSFNDAQRGVVKTVTAKAVKPAAKKKAAKKKVNK